MQRNPRSRFLATVSSLFVYGGLVTGPAADGAGSRFSFSFLDKPRSRSLATGNVPAA